MKTIDHVIIYDIETLREMFLLCIYDPEEKVFIDVEIDKNISQLDLFVKICDKYKDYYWIGYNNLRFDSQVIEYIFRNTENWIEHKTSDEILEMIYQKAQDTINDADYETFPQYRESQLSFKQLDLFTIWHFDNKNKRVGLKRLEFEMDLENIEEMPIWHGKRNLTDEELFSTKTYCHNDVWATYSFYLITRGITTHPLYENDDKLELRLTIEEEFNIPCLNYSDSKIGDEIIKKYYCETKRINYNELPNKGTFRKSIALKDCIPKYVQFKTPQLQEFLKMVKKTILSQTEDFVKSIQFYGQEYTFAKGGLHNVISGVIYENDEETDLIDVDVSGYYPATIINNGYFPVHLGKSFLVGYSKVFYRRLELKPLSKNDNKIKGIVNALKKAGNCPYGKSSDMTSWLYDKKMTLATCLTGEFSLLMLIEDCELEDIHCIMCNTDGATFIVPKTKKETFNKIKSDWIEKTTIALSYTLEEAEFKKMVFSSVNDYIGIKINGEVKCKGDFMKDFELDKNKSARIVPIALEEYYVNNTPIDDTIKSHSNIYDFCIRQKASNSFHYEGYNKLTNNTTMYDKLIRYYVSNTGEKIYKIKNPSCTTNAPNKSQVEAGLWLCAVRNYLPSDIKPEDCDINYAYYIEKAENIIRKIASHGKRRKATPIIPEQLTLF